MDSPESRHTARKGRELRTYLLRRAVAACLDFLILFGLTFAYLRYFGREPGDGVDQGSGCGHLLVLLAAWLLWLPFPEFLFGRTFGKWATDLRVVAVSGRKISLGQALVRHAFDMIDLFMFGLLGLLVAGATTLNQRVGDLIARTRVIEDEPPPPVSAA